jgi:hypothetical protein
LRKNIPYNIYNTDGEYKILNRDYKEINTYKMDINHIGKKQFDIEKSDQYLYKDQSSPLCSYDKLLQVIRKYNKLKIKYNLYNCSVDNIILNKIQKCINK